MIFDLNCSKFASLSTRNLIFHELPGRFGHFSNDFGKLAVRLSALITSKILLNLRPTAALINGVVGTHYMVDLIFLGEQSPGILTQGDKLGWFVVERPNDSGQSVGSPVYDVAGFTFHNGVRDSANSS